MATKLPKGHRMYQMALMYAYSKFPNNIPTFSIPKTTKIYPFLVFWIEDHLAALP
jgi:hypothetical protein